MTPSEDRKIGRRKKGAFRPTSDVRRPTIHSGLFLVLEGIDGCGKDTQLEQLLPWLEDRIRLLGIPGLVISKEPGAGKLGASLRAALLGLDCAVDPLAETLLFLADRAQHMAEVVKPALATDKLVLLNRHTASTVAYQGYGKGVDRDEIRRLNSLVTGDIRPDRIYLLDLDADEALRRLQGRGPGDRLERTGVDFLRRVREGYLALAGQEPDRWCVLQAARPPDVIRAELVQDVGQVISRWWTSARQRKVAAPGELPHRTGRNV